jgi:hypothetical protein
MRACMRHHAAKQYLGLIAPVGHGARRACVNRTAPSSWQWWAPPPEAGGSPFCPLKKTSPDHRWSSHCKAWSAFARGPPPWHRIFNDLVPLTRGGSSLTIFERGGQGLEVQQCSQSLPNYCCLSRQNAVLLAAVRNGVIAAKHAFYRFHRAFRTSFDVPKLHYLLFYSWITKIQHLLPIEAILQSCELQAGLLEGSLEEQCFLGHI